MDDRAPPILDFAIVRESTLGDLAFERALLEAFLEDNQQRLEVLRAGMQASEGERESLVLEAHAMKGAASTLGAQPLADAARALERALASNDVAEAERSLAAVERELTRVRHAIETHLCEI